MAKRTHREIPQYSTDEYAISTTQAGELIDVPLNYDYSKVPEADRDEVMQRARNIKRNEKRSVMTMVAVGQDVIAVQDILPHGEFLPWIEAEFGWEKTTAYTLINLAKKFPGSGLPETLGLSVLYALTAPKAPQAAIEQVIELHHAGEHITKERAVEIVRAAREAEREPKEMRAKELIPIIWRSLRTLCPELETEAERLTWLLEEPKETFDRLVPKGRVLTTEQFNSAVASVSKEMQMRVRFEEEQAQRAAALREQLAASPNFVSASPVPADTAERIENYNFVPSSPSSATANAGLEKRLRNVKADLDEVIDSAEKAGIQDEMAECIELLQRMIEKLHPNYAKNV